MSRIAILDDYQGAAFEHADWSRLRAAHEVRVFREHLGDEDRVAAALADTDIVCIMRERTPFPRSLFARLPRLRLLVTSGARNAAIDLTAARELGVTVCGTTSPGSAAGELAFGLILALARRIAEEDRAIRHGAWQTTIGSDLRGKTLGILGLGRLGSNVAGYGRAFGMRVIAWSRNLVPERAEKLGVEYAPRADFFRESDFISIHVQLGTRNRGLVGAAEFALMKRTAYLVNTSRGPVIDEAALLEALNGGRIAGAGLDVYDREPLPANHPLLATANTVLTSHVGFVTDGTYDVFYRETVEAVEAYLGGRPLRVLAAPV